MVTYTGWQNKFSVRTGSSGWVALDGVQSVTYHVSHSSEAKEECGTRFPTIVEGTYEVTGQVVRFFTGSGIWGFFGLNTPGNTALNYGDIIIYPAGAGNPSVTLGGLKFYKISVGHKPGTNLMTETWDFIGTGSVTIT